ncbi:probable E3 ubiquitin-protein ligase RHB1A isoform X2 [Andrographis paniculata]|uniref:probable E3 ubiquitin-protein ligase RHB1A isoform X2 n=1 Tax=Andrographis paniculata TaxID=175694 RepID=UPI0021E88485|nr:probable E3 ubiquitin-protein ligase RHB1A isoform X2 [Andrographis paniculata]XP_051136850.1 probable E3 ubiquitin-protein ligase RHB1A isoform X2 [Andrographis paniculata]XP_051136851.1 probable E3 ubiquitin-protein ligase RHB1A isoform X2 [Andrographis paniculata]
MGGCCCCASASRSNQLHRSPPFLHNYPASEEREPLSAHHARTSTISTGFLVDTNLDTSSPDTYRPPPAPIPYDRCLGHQPTASGQHRANKSGEVLQPNDDPADKQDEGDAKSKLNCELQESDNLKESTEPVALQDEEDTCPTCFEEYDEDNPKMVTKCDHHFHLACILEWMERSDTCPVCDQEMVFSPAAGG